MRGSKAVDLRNVPIGAWVFASVAVVSLVGGFAVMGVVGADTSELRWLVLTVLNIGGGLASVGSVVYSGAAARSSQVAVQQTNGLHDEEREAIAAAAARAAVAEFRADGKVPS